MRMLTYILRWGYREAREERLSEWTLLRNRGYVKALVRRFGLLFAVVGVVSIWPDRHAGETILASFQDSLRFLVSFFLIFLGVDYFIWRATEKEWKAWNEAKKQQGAAPDSLTRSESNFHRD